MLLQIVCAYRDKRGRQQLCILVTIFFLDRLRSAVFFNYYFELFYKEEIGEMFPPEFALGKGKQGFEIPPYEVSPEKILKLD